MHARCTKRRKRENYANQIWAVFCAWWRRGRKERVCTAKLTNQTFVSVVFMIHSIEYGYYRNCIVIIRIRGACGSTDAHSTELRGYSRLVQNGVIIRPHAGLVLSCLPTGKPLSSRACCKAWPKAIAIIIQASIKAQRVMKVQ